MRAPSSRIFALGAVAIVALLLVVLVRPRAQTGPGGASARPASPSAVVAEVGGERITADEVDRSLGTALDQLHQQVYDMRRNRLDEIIAERLLAQEAARRGVTVDALLQAQLGASLPRVTDEEVDRFYEANRGRLPDQPGIKDQIRTYLQGQRTAEGRTAFVRDLRARGGVTVSLPPPPVTRHQVSIAGAPSRGPADAAVTIVEFTDYHCPFCRRVQPTLEEVLARYPTQVRLVFKDLPLDSLHPQARQAAEASRCAGAQGKFWPFHDKLFERAPDASPATLKAIATEVGLDVAAFDQCVSSGTHREAVQRDVAEALGLGASGTPAFFVNGRFLSGAQPLETFVRIIDDELQLQKSGR